MQGLPPNRGRWGRSIRRGCGREEGGGRREEGGGRRGEGGGQPATREQEGACGKWVSRQPVGRNLKDEKRQCSFFVLECLKKGLSDRTSFKLKEHVA